MKPSIIIFLFFCLSVFSFNAFSHIYKTVNKDGVVTFSDQPSAQSEPVTLAAPNIAIPPEKPVKATDAAKNTDKTAQPTEAVSEKRVDYVTFAIRSPKDQENFHNAESILIQVDLAPALQLGDKIQFLFDGRIISPATTATSFTLFKVINDKPVITRGSHTIQANLIHADGNTIKSTSPITIFAHYTTVRRQ